MSHTCIFTHESKQFFSLVKRYARIQVEVVLNSFCGHLLGILLIWISCDWCHSRGQCLMPTSLHSLVMHRKTHQKAPTPIQHQAENRYSIICILFVRCVAYPCVLWLIFLCFFRTQSSNSPWKSTNHNSISNLNLPSQALTSSLTTLSKKPQFSLAVAAHRPAVSTNEKKADKSWSNVAASNKQEEDVIDYFDFTDWQDSDKQWN